MEYHVKKGRNTPRGGRGSTGNPSLLHVSIPSGGGGGSISDPTPPLQVHSHGGTDRTVYDLFIHICLGISSPMKGALLSIHHEEAECLTSPLKRGGHLIAGLKYFFAVQHAVQVCP